MSLNSLAANRVARELPRARQVGARSVASDDTIGPKQEDVQNALSSLVEYVPAETVTLYLATIASLPTIAKIAPSITAVAVYVVYAALTPALFLMIYAGKRRAAGQVPMLSSGLVPWWPMSAATIAFLAWGIAVPEGPFVADESNRVLGGLLAIIVSTLLGVCGRIFGPKPTTDNNEPDPGGVPG